MERIKQTSLKVNFNLRSKNATNSSGETPINVVIRYSGKKLVYPSGHNIKPANWNIKTQRARNNQDFDGTVLNNYLDVLENT